jgi:hypothetical protein
MQEVCNRKTGCIGGERGIVDGEDLLFELLEPAIDLVSSIWPDTGESVDVRREPNRVSHYKSVGDAPEHTDLTGGM